MRVLAEQMVVTAATVEELGALHLALEHFWVLLDEEHIKAVDGAWRAQFATAVAEIGANIVRHAYALGGTPGNFCLRLRLYPTHVEACFTDHGEPYNASSHSTPHATDDLFDVAESGYGLMLACATLDQLQYRQTPDGMNVWWLAKRFSK